MRFLSPLETTKAIERNVRRAKIPIRFSEGFHPMPKISQLDAIATGVVNLALYIQMEVDSWSDSDFQNLRNTALKGLEPVEHHVTDVDINEIVKGYSFRIVMEKSDLLEFPSVDTKIVKGRKMKVFRLGDLVEDFIVRDLKEFIIVEYTLKRENLFSPWSLVRSSSKGNGLHVPILIEALTDGGTLPSFLIGRDESGKAGHARR